MKAMNKKAWMVSALLLCAAILLTACHFGSSDTPTSSKAPSSEKVSLPETSSKPESKSESLPQESHSQEVSSTPTSVDAELIRAEISDPSGKTVSCSKGDGMMTLFLSMHGADGKYQPTAVKGFPAEISKATKYVVTYRDSADNIYLYKYYLSQDTDNCYFIDHENNPFRIDKAAADAFLNSDFAERIYLQSAAPGVTLGNAELTPYALDWYYITADGSQRKATCSVEDNGTKNSLVSFSTGFKLNFTVQPDEISVTVYDRLTAQKLYEGALDGFRDYQMEGTIEANVQMTVVWKESEGKKYSGTAKYSFDGRMFGKSSFSLSANRATCGDVVILTAYNLASPDEIVVESTPTWQYTPVFYQVGENWQALLPIPYDMVSEKTEYVVKAYSTASSAAAEMILQVDPLSTGDFKSYSSVSAQKLYSKKTLEEFVSAVMPVATAPSSGAFPGGQFCEPVNKNYISNGRTLVYSFGSKVTISGTGISYNALEQAYWAYSGPKSESGEYGVGTKTEVLAAFDGKVVYVGDLSLTGRVVAIDHGGGLLTWYTNLTATEEHPIAVNVGDEVKAGDHIAYVAAGGINEDGFNFHFRVAATVNGVPVNVQSLIDNGIYAPEEEIY